VVTAWHSAKRRLCAVLASIGFISALACQPLDDPLVGGLVKRCPKPCPAECVQSCLPGGYCSSVTRTASEMGITPIAEGSSWILAASGFPPGEDVAYAIRGGFDVVERADRAPSSVYVKVNGDSEGEFLFWASYSSFPLWNEYRSHDVAGQDGAVHLTLKLIKCELIGVNGVDILSTCFIDGTSTFTATLVSTSRWLEAPPCE
jgi:hypothetical protein